MSNICFIVAGMENRVHFLNECIRCYRKSRYAHCDIFLYYQGSVGSLDKIDGLEVFKRCVVVDKPRGVFTPRYDLMKRFGQGYDYVIIIDDDLFIQPETNYFKTVDFMEKNPGIGAVCLTHSQRSVKNEVRIVNSDSDYFNIAGGLVLSKKAVKLIVDYFKGREADYTFDCFWLLLWVKGFDLAKDFRSWAKHVAARKVKGKWSGFNESRVNMRYIPFMQEYLNELPKEFNHGRWEVKIPGFRDINDYGKAERLAWKKQEDAK